ncbi:MAG: 4-alpha-glucanotransferase [Suilimivivens sp.]
MKRKRMERGAGILLSVTSLPSPYGIGSLGKAAYDFVDLLAEMKQKYWQVLPLGPTGYGDSPYQSFSAFAGNPYLIDLDVLIGEGLLRKKEADSVSFGEKENDIDYGILYENRFKVLWKAYKRFEKSNVSYREFCRDNKDWLNDYSMYMAIKNSQGEKSWLEWEEPLRNREKDAMKNCKKTLKKEIGFWKFLQFKFFEQWVALKSYANGKGIKIIGDIPLYVALDSADVWADRKQFKLDRGGKPVEVAGCPPDAFSEDGQKWGNPLYDWEGMERNGFSWWQRRMKANGKLFDIIRIDHFIGVARYFSIPADDPNARGGRWNRGPGKKLTDMIEKTVGKNRIIAEDLGVAVPAVQKLLKRTGWPGMKILLFAFDGNTGNEHLPYNYESGNMAVYAGTHDNETVVGYFAQKEEEELTFIYDFLNIKNREEIPDAIIRAAYGSVADIVIMQMQDILKLGNEARMNFPSTVGSNWRWRFVKGSLTEERKEFIRNLTCICGR